MKARVDNLEKTYMQCISTGIIKEKSVDIELIKSLRTVAEKGLEFINSKSKDIPGRPPIHLYNPGKRNRKHIIYGQSN